jgi:hypothetical protein
MNIDKTYKVDPTIHWLYFVFGGGKWYLEIYELVMGLREFRGSYFVDEQCHKGIAELIEMPWEYYKICLEEGDPRLLKINIDYWFNQVDIKRLIDTISITESNTIIKIKEKI